MWLDSYLYSFKFFVDIYVFMFFLHSLEPIKSFEAPATINSVSLHPEKELFCCRWRSFKLYKYFYNGGEELESYKGHIGLIQCEIQS